ncbi:hypothetical protein MY11210_007629 [Beauveria gryllotalpidicola]
MPPFKFCVIVGALATAVARATGGHAQVVLSTDESPVQQHPLVPVDRNKALEKARECFDTCFARTAAVKAAASVFLVQVFEQGASPEDDDDDDSDAALHSAVGDDKYRKYRVSLKSQYETLMSSKEGEHAKDDDPCD